MNTKRKYQNEKPIDTDLFGGQGHKQVAEAIANVLLFNKSQHIIGIEGNLGAGKSTVINILSQKIIDNGFHVVTFDADQYHTTLKSALIQTIEDELKSLLNKKDKYELAKLSLAVEIALGKRLEYTKNTTSHISLSAIIFAFSLGVSALQVKPSIKFLFDFLKNSPSLDKLSGGVSIFLLILPVVIFSIMKIFGNKTSLGDLVKRNSTDTISETIDINREVGAIELKEAFETFSNLIPKEKSLLLVIDNIDRVSPDIARELWSDIEILTSLGSERFRILLPYSEEHLAKALEKSAVDESQSGKEFITKRIPIPFSAPPIVTTGWRNQFEEYWNETLPDIKGIDGVKDLIEIWAPKITPRYLKSVVNRIGTKIDSCPEPNEYLGGAPCAAYLMAVKDNKLTVNQFLSDPKNINANDDSSSEIERKLKATHKLLLKHGGEKDEWSKQVAALHYQTSFTVAQSELILEPIKRALNTYDTSTLIELSSLLGFDVLFRQQLEATSPSDLVKVTSSLVQKNDGKEVVNKYIRDINHELKYAIDEEYEFDEELIESYIFLLANQIDIELKIVKNRQSKITTTIEKKWSELIPLTSTSLLEFTHYDWENFKNKVKECHAYYRITNITPSFIKNIDPYFFVNIIFPIEKELSYWDIYGKLKSLPTDKLVTAVSMRRKLSDSIDNIYPLILDKMRIGELNDLDNEDLLRDIKFESVDVKKLIYLIPFTSEWKEAQRESWHKNLASRLDEFMYSESLDEKTHDAYTALCTASFVNEIVPNNNLDLRSYNGEYYSSSTEWLARKLEERPGYSRYLTNYLSTCSLIKIITWSKDTIVGTLIFPHLEELIESNRISKVDINSLLTDDYVFLKEHAKNLSPKDILKWMEGLIASSEKPLSWSNEVIDDIISYKSDRFLSVLTQFFDNKDNNQETWLTRIKDNHSTFKKITHYLTSKKYILKYQKPLQQVLKDISDEKNYYNIELITSLTKLIDEEKIDNLRRNLISTFFKSNTTHEKRYRIILYFGSLITIPTINDKSIENEAIELLEYLIENEHNDEIIWLLSQPVNSEGWNITKWSTDGLKALNNIARDNELFKNEKLATIVTTRLNELQENSAA